MYLSHLVVDNNLRNVVHLTIHYRWAGSVKTWPDAAAESKTASANKAQLEPGKNMFELIDVYVVIDHIYLCVCIPKHKGEVRSGYAGPVYWAPLLCISIVGIVATIVLVSD